MEIKEMSVEELIEKRTALGSEVDNPEANLDEIEAEVRAINEELKQRESVEAQKVEIRAHVAAGDGEVIKEIKTEERKAMPEIEVRNTEAYINAYAEYIKSGDDAECRALLSENATNGTVPVPEFVYDLVKTAWDREGIMSRVRKTYLKGNLKVGFEISATGAVKHNEGVSVDEETLVLGIVELVPASIKKWISISDEALDLRGESFLRYIYDELTYQIAKKAADDLLAKIIACGTQSTTTCVGVPAITATTITIDLVAQAIGQLSDDASEPVVIMNKATWAGFKAVQYANGYGVDPFEGRAVLFNNSLKSLAAATPGETWMIVGDLGQGALANFPNGNVISFKFDDLTLAAQDLVRVIGREFVACEPVAPNAFVKVKR